MQLGPWWRRSRLRNSVQERGQTSFVTVSLLTEGRSFIIIEKKIVELNKSNVDLVRKPTIYIKN